MVWYFIGVYIMNRKLHGRLKIQNFSSHDEKYFTRSLHLLVKYYSPYEEKFRISTSHVIFSLYTSHSGQWETVGALAVFGSGSLC